jgi:hypothetical protein
MPKKIPLVVRESLPRSRPAMVVVRPYCNFPFPAKLLLAALLLGVPVCSQAAGPPSTRAELLFSLSSAVKERNKDGILACFNLEGADDNMRLTIESAAIQICRWPTNHVFSSERSGTGPLQTNRDGKTWSLNGDWEFQVHIFLKADQPSKGFVFPAGKTRGPKGHYAILVLVEQNR